MEKKKTLMITGASGFVGSNFIKKYKDEYNIIPVCLIKDKPEELNYTGVDCILHLAALVHQMEGAPEEKYFEVNTELTRRLAVKAKEVGVPHFVFYSTVAVWGTHGYFDHNRIITLDTPTNPKTPYGKSKLKAEEVLHKLENENFFISILRPPMVYGKGCPGNLPRLKKLVEIFPVLPFGNDENKRSMVCVDTLLKETNNLIKNKKRGTFIPKDNKNRSLKKIIIELAGGKNKILIPLPKIVIKILRKIKPNLIESLFGSLGFE